MDPGEKPARLSENGSSATNINRLNHRRPDSVHGSNGSSAASAVRASYSGDGGKDGKVTSTLIRLQHEHAAGQTLSFSGTFSICTAY